MRSAAGAPHHPRRLANIAAALVCAALLASGCSGNDEASADGQPAPVDAEVATAPTGMLALLATIPDNLQARSFIHGTDLTAMRAARWPL